jgi:hypothetical protein
MIHTARGFTLSQEALHRLAIGYVLRLQHLDGDSALHKHLSPLIDNPHTAMTDDIYDVVLAHQTSADHWVASKRNESRPIMGTGSDYTGELSVALKTDFLI